MFLKQYNYKPRSGSVSSQETAGSASSPPKDNKITSSVQQAVNQPKGPAARRLSSTTDKFAGLSAHKRSQDADKKASIADQKTGGQGVLSGAWNTFTKGS
ncbi:hypothetical protein DV736_g3532, partial [Chaetothyriales sp. CBS 134916]